MWCVPAVRHSTALRDQNFGLIHEPKSGSYSCGEYFNPPQRCHPERAKRVEGPAFSGISGSPFRWFCRGDKVHVLPAVLNHFIDSTAGSRKNVVSAIFIWIYGFPGLKIETRGTQRYGRSRYWSARRHDEHLPITWAFSAAGSRRPARTRCRRPTQPLRQADNSHSPKRRINCRKHNRRAPRQSPPQCP